MLKISSLIVVPLLVSCGSSTTVLVDSVRRAIAPSAIDTAVLNPAYRYLRASTDKNVALLVLGYLDATPEPATEVWYSADKETIRLWNGRIAGTAGLRTDWRSVRFTDVPTWRSALSGPASYRRQRDVMPGYAIGVREQVDIVPMAGPSSSAPANLPAEVRWFEERTRVEGQAPVLPPARFAVDLSGATERVVYSEQCLSTSVCLALQPWPPSPPATAAKSSVPSPT